MVDLRQLRHFVTVCEELHFRRAAERLGMTQPPLTQSIQGLEAELGVALFERTKHRVALTKAGEALLGEARAALTQADRFVATAHRARLGQVGTLRIGFSISASFCRPFTQAMRNFQRDYPDVTLELRRIMATGWMDMLMQGDLDLCVIRPVYPVQLPASLRYVTVQQDELMLLLNRGHPLRKKRAIALADVAGEPFILHPARNLAAVHTQVMKLWTAAGLVPQVSQEIIDTPTIMGLVAAGMGLSILPSIQKVIRVDDVIWRPLDAHPALTATGVIAVCTAARAVEAPQAAFLDLIVQAAQDAGHKPPVRNRGRSRPADKAGGIKKKKGRSS
jgi:DNA-binding transcriptional LysR family regulator